MTETDFERTFSNIYATRAWGKGSGPGSRARHTRHYRRFLEDFLAENAVASVVDFGCGDWQISSQVAWGSVRYLGLDIVPSLIEELRKRYARPGIDFAVTPTNLDDIPQADLLLVKDVLQHWPNEAIAEFLDVVVPRYRRVLITNDVQLGVPPATRRNPDVPTGGWRDLDIRADPFHREATSVVVLRGPRAWQLRPRAWRSFGRPCWTKQVLLLQNGG